MASTQQFQGEISRPKSNDKLLPDQTSQQPNPLGQKSHNDKHIFYSLKTASFDSGNQSIFSLAIQSNQAIENRRAVRIQSRKNARNSIILKTSVPQNSFSSEGQINQNTHDLKRASSIQRFNKKIEIKNTVMPYLKKDSSKQREKKLWTDNSVYEGFKLKRKKENQQRNYFNVKELMDFQSQRKKGDAVILIKNTSNTLIKRKKQNILGKIELSSQRLKQFQFKAIQITKNIVEKSYEKYNGNSGVYNNDKGLLVKPKKLYNEGLSGMKKELVSAPTRQYFEQKLIEGIYEQRGSLWRSNSYQLPRSKEIPMNSMDRTRLTKHDKKEQNYVRSVHFDNNIELNPWSMGHELNFSNLKNRYSSYNKESKHPEEEHEFLNYYIKTSRHQK